MAPGKPSQKKRLMWATLLGIVVGLMAFLTIPIFMPSADLLLRLAFWAWYVTVGGAIGLAGIRVHQPVLKRELPFWIRGALIGGWMNLVLVLFTHELLAEMLVAANATFGTKVGSPYWVVMEGAMIGLIIDGIASTLSARTPPAD